MRWKPKNKRTTIVILLVALAAVILAKSLGFANTRSATRIGYVGHEGRSSWSGSYALLHGTMKKSIHPAGDVLKVEVQTESGDISLEIRDAGGEALFEKEGLATGAFEVAVSGKVTVWIRAVNHRGGFSIS